MGDALSAISTNCSAILLHLFIALGKKHTKDMLASKKRAGLKGDDYLAFHKETERVSRAQCKGRKRGKATDAPIQIKLG